MLSIETHHLSDVVNLSNQENFSVSEQATNNELPELTPGKKLAFTFFAIIIMLILVEVLGQAALFVKRQAFPIECRDPNEATCPIQPFQADQLNAIISDPLTGYRWQPGFESEWININALGFRGDEVDLTPAEDTYRVVMVGGSAAFGVGVRDDETIEHYLQAELGERMAGSVEVINAGVTSYLSSQELAQILYHVTALEPDLIIVYDGRNDVYFGTSPRWQPHYTPAMQDQRENTRYPDARSFSQTRLGTFLSTKSAIGIAFNQLKLVISRSPVSPGGQTLEMNEAAIDVYQLNLERMVSAAELENIDIMLVMQPSLAAGDKPLTDAELDYIEFARGEGYYDLLAEYYPDGTAALLQVGEDRGVPAYDFTTIFDSVEETIYLDEVHLTPEGNQMVADNLADLVLQQFGQD